jgi:hypothetical protein
LAIALWSSQFSYCVAPTLVVRIDPEDVNCFTENLDKVRLLPLLPFRKPFAVR